MSCGSGMHPKHIYRSSANVGTAKALDRVVARIAREETAAPTDPAPGDDEAAPGHDELERDQASEVKP